MSKIKVAIIGVGGIANMHIKSYQADDRCEVYAICDINPARLELMGKKYGIARRYTDKDQMLAELPEIDVVSVCTWNSAHAECTIAALNAGKHVLCEKPMAMNAAEAKAMAEAAEKNNRLLMIGFVRRHAKNTDVVTRFTEAGDIGELYYAKASYLRRAGAPGGWFGDKSRSGGGPMIDLGVHVIDLARYLAGGPKPVSAYAATFHKLGDRRNISKEGEYQSATTGEVVFDVEDMATALIRFEGGFTIAVETSFSLNINEDIATVQLFGTKAGVALDPELALYTEQNGFLTNVTLPRFKTSDFADMFGREIRHFLDCVIDNVPCKAPAEDGIVLMKILDAIYKSAETGHEALIEA